MWHGTVSLLAALEVHSGKVLGRCVPRHTSEEFVNFLDEAVATYRTRRSAVPAVWAAAARPMGKFVGKILKEFSATMTDPSQTLQPFQQRATPADYQAPEEKRK